VKYSKDDQIEAACSRLVSAGWEWIPHGRHAKLRSPDGRKIAIPGSPSDHRTAMNFKCAVRRMENEK